MNASNLQILRTLVAKDWRLFRVPMVALIFVGVGAYVLATMSIVDDDLSQRHNPNLSMSPASSVVAAASMGAIALTGLIACAPGGVAIAGERADRSGDFMALLPVPRAQIILSKLLTSAMMLGLFVLIHLMVAGSILFNDGFHRAAPGFQQHIWTTLAADLVWLIGTTVCLFGVGWFFSTFLNSGPISACVSIAVTSIAMVVTAVLMDGHHVGPWYGQLTSAAVAFAIGLPSLIGGVVYYLKRIAP